MTSTTPPTGECQPSSAAPAGSATCSQKPEQQRGMPIDVRRIMGLDTAAKMVGTVALAEEMGVSVRALNYKTNGERGASDDDMLAAVRLIERRAAKLLSHAYKLRAVIGDPVSQAQSKPLPVQIAAVLAHCDHIERFAYERAGQGLDASPHLLSAEARRLAAAVMAEGTKTGARA